MRGGDLQRKARPHGLGRGRATETGGRGISKDRVDREVPPKVSASQALITLAIIVPLVWLYVWIESALGLATVMFAGFLFIFYWASIMKMVAHELLPSLLGSIGGIGLAYLIHALPAAAGPVGVAVIGVLILSAIYLLVRGQAPFVVNNALMLMLTIGSSGVFKTPAGYALAALSVLVAALYAGGLLALSAWAVRLKRRDI